MFPKQPPNVVGAVALDESPMRRTPLRLEVLPTEQPRRDKAISDHLFALTQRVNATCDEVTEHRSDTMIGFRRVEGAVSGVHDDIRILREDVTAIVDRIGSGAIPHTVPIPQPPSQHSGPHRMRALSLSDYNPDHTPAGGIRISGEDFEKMKAKFETQEREREREEAEKKGAQAARAEAEARSSKLQKNVLFYLSIMGAGAGVVTYLLSHFLHF